jgi:hypothetical protein
MRRLLLAPLLLSLALPAMSSVDPKVHKICMDVKDYVGCVSAHSASPASPGSVNTVINREGLVTNEGNICPDGYASKGVGYCGKVNCEQCISFGCLSGNDKILGGKNWKCDRGMYVYLLRWGDSIIRASYDPNCPAGPFKPGFNSTCEQRDFEMSQAGQK